MGERSPSPWEVVDGGNFVRTVGRGRCVARLDWNLRDEVDDANAAFIVRACNSHDALIEALEAWDRAEDARNGCTECENEGPWEHCAPCSERFGDAIDMRHAAIAKARGQ